MLPRKKQCIGRVPLTPLALTSLPALLLGGRQHGQQERGVRQLLSRCLLQPATKHQPALPCLSRLPVLRRACSTLGRSAVQQHRLQR